MSKKEATDRTKRKHWAEQVFKRDKKTCQKCGTKENLHAHHIIEWHIDESKRFDLDNGLTLCDNCHKATHGYGLNDKQKMFCLEYLKDFNATRAYMETYGSKSENVAGAAAFRLLRNVKIIEFLNQRKTQLTEEKEITVDWVLNGIKSIGDTGTKDSDRLKAFELGGKYKKVFSDRNENITITYDISKLPPEYLKRISDGENYINVIADYEHSIKSS